ncbi:hypothetical protein GCM10011385_14340 [Nitratireductor aestuarii]|uniref:Uncharacterized protein n=1 Tax=Nitratireductor aestuarii TaxID=1735103 RepID=A0A916RNF7_9HYPH|nr:hypothetical protein GCM10011385_14340 [Nitratireductor aestuarii]
MDYPTAKPECCPNPASNETPHRTQKASRKAAHRAPGKRRTCGYGCPSCVFFI